MDFQNVNPLNVHMNFFSGNLLPLTSGDSRFSVVWKIYSALLWLILVIQTIALIFGIMYVPWEKALTDSAVTIVITMEVFFINSRIHGRRKLVDQLIRELNDILRIEDEAMRYVVITTLKPMQVPLKFYSIAGGISVLIWWNLPFLMVFEKVSFFYEDYKMPAAFCKQPFSTNMFLLGSATVMVGNTYLFFKKVGLDIYMIHLVLLLTSQYRYIAMKLETIFRNEDPQSGLTEFCQEYDTGINRWAEEKIRALCRHHNAIIHLSIMLKKLLSVNFSMIYVNSVLRFCFIGVMLSTYAVRSPAFLEGFLVFTFTCGAVVQFYMLCSCVQQLLDASMTMTNKAFHEKWYQFGSSVKRIFMLMIIGNNLECKLSTCDKFNLSLSSFMSILNQSYSIALLFSKVQ